MDLLSLETEKSPPEPIEVPEPEPHVYSVSEINKDIRQILEKQFSLLWIQGEISNFKAHSSGHYYFSLKDQKAQVNAVMFRGFNSRLKFRPEDGQEVLVRGKITVYEPRGNYQVFCEIMEPVGAGALQIAFEQLKKKLSAEGLFDESRKRALPTLPKHVALVTSPTGAAVRDMLNVLGRRFRGLQITVVPVIVQGEKAAPSIVEGLRQANLLADVDAIIVGRGGGSIEDLWAFNEEIVARAIVASAKPVISAVGHEVDFTIADFVADLRAPTPSAAAELVVKNAQEIIERLVVDERRLITAMRNALVQLHNKVAHTAKRLIDPQRRLQDLMIRCDELAQRLEGATLRFLKDRHTQVQLRRQRLGRPQEQINQLNQRIQLLQVRLSNLMGEVLKNNKAKMAQLGAVLDSLSPLKVLERGYSIVRKDQKIVKSADEVRAGDEIAVRFFKGEASATIKNVNLQNKE